MHVEQDATLALGKPSFNTLTHTEQTLADLKADRENVWGHWWELWHSWAYGGAYSLGVRSDIYIYIHKLTHPPYSLSIKWTQTPTFDLE